MNNISVLNKKNCTGCRMCEQICPVSAIIMSENEEGFIEPVVNEEKCVNCGLCKNRCPQLNDVNKCKKEDIKVYAGKNKDKIEQFKSSSGGIFSILANYILENNGIVYGCAFNNMMEAEHIGVSSIDELVKLRGSKYVQSNTKRTFVEVKENLKENKIVLYSGTPCQIAGLKAFLGQNYENLYCIDLVCHGVPSPKLFKKYIKWLEKKNKSKILSYDFKNKEKNGWGSNAKISYENGKIEYKNFKLDPYYKTFIKSLDSRECCYNCKYATMQRCGDITLADYWGIEKEHPEFYDEKGVSAILVNNEKGKKLFESVKNKIELKESNVEKVAKSNHNLNSSARRSEIRNDIYKNMDDNDFEKYIKEQLKFKIEAKDMIKNFIPYSIKKKIKNIKK